MKPKLESRLRECAVTMRGLARQIVSPQSVHQEWMQRADTCDEAAEELERLNEHHEKN